MPVETVISAVQVFGADLDTQGSLYVSLKDKSLEKHGQYGIG